MAQHHGVLTVNVMVLGLIPTLSGIEFCHITFNVSKNVLALSFLTTLVYARAKSGKNVRKNVWYRYTVV